jgi:MtfA peptidase
MSVFDFFKNRRRDGLRREPLTEAQRAVLTANMPYVAKLDDEERQELEALVQIFLDEKSFEGCGGLTITDEMRLAIAGQACLLLLHRDTDIYPGVDSILVYPRAYVAPHQVHDGGVVHEGVQSRLGETSTRGAVVLAWDHVASGGRDVRDGQNVVMHEFAHQLDGEDGAMDGVPALATRAAYRSWAQVLGAEFATLVEQLAAGHRSKIDAYGATNPAEFFAVVTEMFFEQGHKLQRDHAELYAQLAAFYQQDPAAR